MGVAAFCNLTLDNTLPILTLITYPNTDPKKVFDIFLDRASDIV